MFSHFILEHKHETLSRVLLARKNSNLGQIPKFYPLMYILQTRWQMLLGKKKFLGFHFPIAHWKGHVLQTKLYKTIIPSGFVFQKLLMFYKLLKSGRSLGFLPKAIQKLNSIFR